MACYVPRWYTCEWSPISVLTWLNIIARHRRRSVYNIVGVHGNGDTQRAEDRSSKSGVLGEGMFPSPPATGSGKRCSKLFQWGPQ